MQKFHSKQEKRVKLIKVIPVTNLLRGGAPHAKRLSTAWETLSFLFKDEGSHTMAI